MAQLQVKNPSIIDTMLELTDSGKISAISGHELVGNSEQQTTGYWRPIVDNGELSWSWDTQSTAVLPSTADITGPQGKQGKQGLPGADGASGTSVNLKSVNEVIGGTEITLSWGQNDTSAFIVPNGTPGKDGSNGVSPTIELEPIVTGTSGTKISITDVNGTSSFNVMNGADGSYEGMFECSIGSTTFAELMQAKSSDKYIYGTLNNSYYSLDVANNVHFVFRTVYDHTVESWQIDSTDTWTSNYVQLDGSTTEITTSGYITGNGTTADPLTLTSVASEAIESISSKLTSKENTSHIDWALKDVYVCTESELANLAQTSTNGSIFFIISASN